MKDREILILLSIDSIDYKEFRSAGVLCPSHGKALVSDLPILLIGVGVDGHLKGGDGRGDPSGVRVAAIPSLI